MERSDAPCQVAKFDLVEPGGGNHFGKFALPREAADAFDEIGICVTVTGDHLAKVRYNLKAIEIVKRLQEWSDLGSKFQA